MSSPLSGLSSHASKDSLLSTISANQSEFLNSCIIKEPFLEPYLLINIALIKLFAVDAK